ncbi:MAG: hypothetical protein AAB113_07855, partial [Candidatus Eisenbacteria bacterium]
MKVAPVLALLCGLAVAPVAAVAQDAQRVPFQPPPFTGLIVPDEFIVVFGPHVRQQLVARRDARGRLAVSLPSVQRLLDRGGALDIRRELA